MEKDTIAKLEEIISHSKWSQEQFAYNLGVSFSTLNGQAYYVHSGIAKPPYAAFGC